MVPSYTHVCVCVNVHNTAPSLTTPKTILVKPPIKRPRRSVLLDSVHLSTDRHLPIDVLLKIIINNLLIKIKVLGLLLHNWDKFRSLKKRPLISIEG